MNSRLRNLIWGGCLSALLGAAGAPASAATVNNPGGNDSVATAFSLDGYFSLEFDGDIESGDGTNESTTIPHVTVNAVPDVVALVATPSGDGTLHLPGVGGSGAFAMASVNVGAEGTITATPGFPGPVLPVAMSICETDPVTSACLGTAGASATTTIAAGATPTFAVFATATDAVAFNAAINRIAVTLTDAAGIIRGATSVAVTTVP